MAIVTPGKRPSPRVQNSVVLGKKMGHGKKQGYAELMLTSLVDMFTIIVIFLIQNFSSSGDILYMSKDIKLPYAVHGVELERAPVISVSGDSVTLDGKQVAATEDLSKGDVLNVPELEDALREEKRKFEFINANNPDKPFRGLVNVQADKKIPFKVIKRVMFACNQSGFGNITFAAMAKGSGKTAETKPQASN
ncbi:MAG: biopolymer transporter ExbD [Deltaproteobacteria bacterium]|nr:biopolymer transporter ExbD [Deltaproteobacteria bacterium]